MRTLFSVVGSGSSPASAFSSSVSAAERLPVNVITRYLGAGKTTLLNPIPTHEHGLKVAEINSLKLLGP